MENTIVSALLQLGAAGVIGAALVVVTKAYYDHTNEEIAYLRNQIVVLQAKVLALESGKS